MKLETTITLASVCLRLELFESNTTIDSKYKFVVSKEKHQTFILFNLYGLYRYKVTCALEN